MSALIHLNFKSWNEASHVNHDCRCDRVDRVSLVLFPLMFFLVNVMYWSYYLLLNDIIAELW